MFSRNVPLKIIHVMLLTLAILFPACGSSGPSSYQLVLLQTNDTHSQILGVPNCAYDPTKTGDGTLGGAARYGTLMDQIRQEAAGAKVKTDFLNLSSGDFTMGSIMVVGEHYAADLNLLKRLKFDAAGLGNHEFDWGAAATAAMITQADQPPVPLLCADLHFSDTDTSDDTLAALYGQEGQAGKLVYPYIVRTLPSGLKVGIFGLVGVDAGNVSGAPKLFPDTMASLVIDAQAAVDKLRKTEGVDFVILLGHLGLHMDGSTPSGETTELAKKVSGIDVILSGHYHNIVQHPVAIPSDDGKWTTWAMEAGSDGRYLGRWDLTLDGSGKVKVADGQLYPIDDQILGLSDINTWTSTLISDIETNLLSKFPLVPAAGAFLTGKLFQVLIPSDFDVLEHAGECNNMAYLLADAMRDAAQSDLAAVSSGGDCRGSLLRCNGGFDFADTFGAAPLGIGPDQLVGYPLVTFFLTLKQIKLVLEFTTADKGMTNDDYLISLSGMKIEMDTSKTQLSRINKITIYQNLDESDAGTVLFDLAQGGFLVDQNKLYSISTSIYIARFLASFNLSPLDKNGNPVTDLNSLIVKDSGGREVKLWYVLAGRLAAFNGKVSELYDDDAKNPRGPYWRRCWDFAKHTI